MTCQPLAAHEAYKEAQGAERPVQIHAHPDGQQAAVEGQHTQVAEAHPEGPHGHDAHGHGKAGIACRTQDVGHVKLEGQMNSETMLNHTITSSAMA